MALLGSVDANNGSYDPSPNGQKNLSLLSGQFQGGQTRHAAPQSLNQRQKRSQNESAEKIKRLQKLMDERDHFSNFNQSDD